MRTHFLRRSCSLVPLLIAVTSVLGFLNVGCKGRSDEPTAPPRAVGDKAAPPPGNEILSLANPRVQAVAAIQRQRTPELMANAGIVGTAVGLTRDGRLAIQVYTAEPQLYGVVPQSLDGIPVLEQITGPIRSMALPKQSVELASAHTAKQQSPIQLGTSGGWRYDLANGYCCGGTLGSLVWIGTAQYILSNYHVFRSDIVPGGNHRVATNGDPVIHPGLIDVRCSASGAQNVGTLAGQPSLPGSNVDCAIAKVVPGMVATSGAILEIGTISAATVAASVGQPVKKSGRTTGLTRSVVSGLNATVRVVYDNECAGGAAFTKTYTGQIILQNRNSTFLNSGDSGSLLVQDVTTSPKAIGLLYAGSGTIAVANPIGSVLSFLGATMVGQ